ncbi:TIGR01212 family radical SAM protein [Escherichia coli]
MQLQKLVNMFGGDLTRCYGQKVHKLTLHGGFSCPNRDGTIGRGGCTFCNVASFADEAQQHRSIAEQLAHQANLVNRAKRYLAYFQAYTSTFAEVQVLRSMYQQAVSQANIVGLCVGTRPDCVPDAVLDLLCEYKDQGYEVWLELGLQTAHDKTLHRINRGHDFACYQRTTQLARQRGLKVCSHLIVGLPGEGQAECLQTLERVVETGVDGIKLHPLHIVKGSIMAKAWEAGRLNGIELEDYTLTAGEMIRHTPPEVIYHRISASARRPTLLAPLWCENRWTGMVELDRYLNEHGVQGSALGRPWLPPTEYVVEGNSAFLTQFIT